MIGKSYNKPERATVLNKETTKTKKIVIECIKTNEIHANPGHAEKYRIQAT